jgi:hypothetical protein
MLFFQKKQLIAVSLLSQLLAVSVGAEENASIKIKDVSTSEDTSVIIKKGALPLPSDTPVFEIVSGTDEVSGDLEAGVKESWASWKTACENWKKEFKENNKENQIITLNCNSPSSQPQKNGMQVHVSTATYKIKVLKTGKKQPSNPSN